MIVSQWKINFYYNRIYCNELLSTICKIQDEIYGTT